MLLRLKDYSQFMYERYRKSLELIKHDATRSVDDKLILTSYLTTGQSVLFFNQSEPNRSFIEWSSDPDNPISYQLKLNHCLSLLVDSACWAINASVLEIENFPEKVIFQLNLENFRIEEVPEDKDGLTKQYFNTCDLLHRICPQNTRMRESLIRLIQSYLVAKDLTAQARNLSNFDRLEYLRHLTKYS